jgi:hypothetical protein
MVLVATLLASPACPGSELTALEQRWLRGAWPVLEFARASGWAMDVVVQPQPTPGATPMALGFVGGRCKLVLSMRGNPRAQATLDRIEPELHDAALQLMAAHELGHCQRHLDGTWQQWPAGFSARPAPALPAELATAYAEMQAVRREEGYADLVGLAWIRLHHPALYARMHAWLLAERSRDRIAGSHHDTLAWIQAAANARATGGRSIFADAAARWGLGLATAD